VLIKTYGRDLFLAGVFKLCWTAFLIMGAYFFTRSILLCIRTLEGLDTSPFDTEWKGWVLTGFFFIDAWLLGGCALHLASQLPESSSLRLNGGCA
jgi:ATP-binding cassette subfamily C (CFTR/MRP) protein 1